MEQTTLWLKIKSNLCSSPECIHQQNRCQPWKRNKQSNIIAFIAEFYYNLCGALVLLVIDIHDTEKPIEGSQLHIFVALCNTQSMVQTQTNKIFYPWLFGKVIKRFLKTFDHKIQRTFMGLFYLCTNIFFESSHSCHGFKGY